MPRPVIYPGTDNTDAQRRLRAARRAEGARSITVMLPPDAVAALDTIRSATHETTAQLIRRALLALERP